MEIELSDLVQLDRDLERLERLEARDKLAVYCGLQLRRDVEGAEPELAKALPMEARYIPAKHHRLIIKALEAVERGEIKRLMIFAPPGIAKSTYASVLFPAWYLGRYPSHCILQGSYNDQLATRFARRARNTFASEVHQSIFPLGVAEDSKAAGQWETTAGGEYFAFGVNTGVTGRRAHGIILDDLIKGRAEANSETVRERTWDTYVSDVRTRLYPNSWIIYITTRWHEDDPAGRILPTDWNGESGWVTAKDGEKWYVVCLVAVVEDADEERKDPLGRKIGEHIWPEWFPKKHFDQERITQGPYNWAALYQQRPQPLEGGIFKRPWFKLWPADQKLPRLEFVVQSYDTAYTQSTHSDDSACVVFGVFVDPKTGHNCLLVSDAWNEKLEYTELRKRVKREFHSKYGGQRRPDLVLVEEKGSGITLLQDLAQLQVPAHPYNPGRADKITRAHAAAPFVAAGHVYILESEKNRGAPVSWVNELLRQLLSFPNADKDDLVDAFTQGIILLRNKEIVQARITGLAEDEPEQAEPEPYYNPYAI